MRDGGAITFVSSFKEAMKLLTHGKASKISFSADDDSAYRIILWADRTWEYRTGGESTIDAGGVYRCCLDYDSWPEDPKEGDVLKCPHHPEKDDHGLVYHAETWEGKWKHQKS